MVEGRRVRSGLLVVQGALSTVLLVGAFLFVRSLDRVRAVPLGYDAERVLIVNRVVRGPAIGTDAIRAMTAALVAEAEALPQVEAAAWVVSAPFISTSNVPVFVDGVDSTGHLGIFTYQVTTPGYFRTMGTRILRGRGIEAGDRLGAPDVAVVSESMARTLWPGRDALGACFRPRDAVAPCITVVGIAEDMIQRDITGGQPFHYYLSLDQSTRQFGNAMVVRVRGDALAEAEGIRRALQRVLPVNAYLTMQPLGPLVTSARRSWRLGATMFAAFGVLALVVAAVGLYGVIAYDVAQRGHELGVRVALGASRGRILRLVIGSSSRLMLAGVALGVMIAALSGRWIEPLLFRQAAVDPAAYAAVGALMLVVAVVASAVPAWKASSADPAGALRAE
jgi:predicted permease